MSPSNNPLPPQSAQAQKLEINAIAVKINEVLKQYSDKDWNYSRISLEEKSLDNIKGPYALWIDFIATSTKQGRNDFQTYSQEVTWGARHSSELGILELISLRLNKTLIELTNDETWNYRRPVIRLIKKEELVKQGITNGLWYVVEEVIGEDFDNR